METLGSVSALAVRLAPKARLWVQARGLFAPAIIVRTWPEGAPRTYDELHREWGAYIRNQLHRINKVRRNDAELLQTVWEGLISARLLDRYVEHVAASGDPSNADRFRAYLRCAIRSRFSNFLRYKSRRERDLPGADDQWENSLPSVSLPDTESEHGRILLIQRAMGQLTDVERRVIEARWFGEGKRLGIEAIARQTGLTKHAAVMTSESAMRKMADWIEGRPVRNRTEEELIDAALASVGIVRQ